MPHSFNYRVIGHVQGVFFRAFTQKTAQELGVKGFVKNDPNGDVSGVAQGDAAALEKFKDAISKGPRHAKVSEVNLNEEMEMDHYDYVGFDILRH
ncbi:acylphosphatase isozyme Ch1 [Ramaria rubella]|nr:acylphosphatase isozyme Ch1 [Ramaria rubella]